MLQQTRTHLTFTVPTIRDAHCIRMIEEFLAGIDGVSNEHASVESAFGEVELDPAKITAGKVQALLGEAGYLPKT